MKLILREYLALPKPPFGVIEEITYMDLGIQKTLSPSLYSVDDSVTPAVLYIDELPEYEALRNAIKITFTSGYMVIPSDLAMWIKVRVSTLYEYRENLSEVKTHALPKSYIDAVLERHRVRLF